PDHSPTESGWYRNDMAVQRWHRNQAGAAACAAAGRSIHFSGAVLRSAAIPGGDVYLVSLFPQKGARRNARERGISRARLDQLANLVFIHREGRVHAG